MLHSPVWHLASCGILLLVSRLALTMVVIAAAVPQVDVRRAGRVRMGR